MVVFYSILHCGTVSVLRTDFANESAISLGFRVHVRFAIRREACPAVLALVRSQSILYRVGDSVDGESNVAAELYGHTKDPD